MQSKEELDGKLQAFPDLYLERTGTPFNIKDLEQYLLDHADKLKKEFIDRAFSGLSVAEATYIIDQLRKAQNSGNIGKVKHNNKTKTKTSKE